MRYVWYRPRYMRYVWYVWYGPRYVWYRPRYMRYVWYVWYRPRYVWYRPRYMRYVWYRHRAAQVQDSVKAYSTKGIVTNSLSTLNNLVYSLEGANGTAPAPAPTNQPPTATFSASCTNLSCQFTDRSTEADGTITSWSWNFGDGTTSALQNPSHSYAAAGTYTVTERVTDNGGASGTASASLSVTAPAPAPAPAPSAITLTVSGSKSGNKVTSDLSWSGATSTYVDIYRNNTRIATVSNTGSYRDVVRVYGSGTIAYKVCQSGSTATCSGTASVRC